MEDRSIIALFFARSEQAIREVEAKYAGACTHLAMNILGNREDALECVNDAYFALWNAIPPEEPDPLRAYVLRIVRNLSITRYRANTARKRDSRYDVSLEELSGAIPAPERVEDALEAKELTQALNRFLEGLDTPSRVLFVRRYWYADSAGELAARFGTSPHNISVRLHRIRQKLEKYLRKEGIFL